MVWAIAAMVRNLDNDRLLSIVDSNGWIDKQKIKQTKPLGFQPSLKQWVLI